MKVLLVDSLRVMLFVAVQSLIAISNAILMRRLNGFAKTDQQLKVSVLIPVRNEEQTIEGCLRSLLMQDYNNFEIIVFDDDSSDKTKEILSAVKSDKLKVLTGKVLPNGWIGKSWACQQLSKVATGDLLLFTDADTVYRPNALSCAVNALIETNADLITAVHYNQIKTFGEMITVPFPVYAIFSILPLAIAYSLPRLKALSSANGKFMLFRRSFYEKIGGHSAVRCEIVEDVALARLVKANGGSWRMLDGSRLVVARMYESFAEAVNGFSKNYFGIFNYRILLSALVWFWIGIITFYPLLTLFYSLMSQNLNLNFCYSFATTIMSCFIWLLLSIKFGFPLFLFLFYPVIILVAIWIGVRSMVLSITNKNTWKGRQIRIAKIRWI
ncbi:MAG: glycosyltransferase [candidate division WOR-3 bacterium]|nr:glycosyltransferase [candidate division WOR-3 bacterium]